MNLRVVNCYSYRNKYKSRKEMHSHAHDELGLCVSGGGLFFIGNKVFAFSAGSVSFVSGGMPHIAQSSDKNPSEWIFFDIEGNEDHGSNNSEAMSGTIANTVCYNEDIRALLNMAAKEWFERPQAFQDICNNLVAVCYSWLRRFLPPNESSGEIQSDERIMPALNYIALHCTEPISTEILAELCGYSVCFFRRLFKAATGCTPHTYITNAMLAHAAMLLRTTTEQVLEICLLSGFNSLSGFNREFKKRFACSPREYRNNNRG